MKAVKTVILLVVVITLLNAVRGDYDFALPMVLPLLGGKKPSIYDLAGGILILIGVIGFLRLASRRKDED